MQVNTQVLTCRLKNTFQPPCNVTYWMTESQHHTLFLLKVIKSYVWIQFFSSKEVPISHQMEKREMTVNKNIALNFWFRPGCVATKCCTIMWFSFYLLLKWVSQWCDHCVTVYNPSTVSVFSAHGFLEYQNKLMKFFTENIHFCEFPDQSRDVVRYGCFPVSTV